MLMLIVNIISTRKILLYCVSLAASSSSRLEYDSLTVEESYQGSRWVINTARNFYQKFIRAVFSLGIGYDHGQSNCIGGTGRAPCGNWDLAQAALHSEISLVSCQLRGLLYKARLKGV